MKLTDFLRPEFCVMDLKAVDKDAVIRELASVMMASGKVNDKEDFIKHIMERERLGSTGIGNHVAIPHAPTQSVDGLVVAFGRSVHGVDFQSLDGDEVNLIFLLGTNPDDLGVYLKFLATLSKLLSNRQFREEFMAADSPEAVIEALKKHEKS
jgi:fructose-specific phosphotransferase system IIA component